MKVVFTSSDGSKIVPLEMEPGQTVRGGGARSTFTLVTRSLVAQVEDAKALLEVEMGIPTTQQSFLLNNSRVPDHSKLESTGIADGTVVAVLRDASRILASAEGRVADDYRGLTWNDVQGMPPPEVLQLVFDANPGMLADLQFSNPKLAEAFRSRDLDNVRRVMMRDQLDRIGREQESKQREESLRRRLQANPMDVEAQRELEDLIRQANVNKNYELAMEHMPEAFTNVSMLYINTRVNGVPVKAFVDSGAQTTIMSPECAERCGIMRLVDRRFAGQAVGVGTAKIVGRVHMSPLQIGDKYFNCTFTVMESKGPKATDLLFGLDMLKRFQCEIDLYKNELRLRCEGAIVSVPFLGESEIPADAFGGASRAASSGAADSGEAGAAGADSAQGQAQGQGEGQGQSGASAASAAGSGSGDGGGEPVADEDAKVAQLTALGIPAETARGALRQCGGDVDMAASLYIPQ